VFHITVFRLFLQKRSKKSPLFGPFWGRSDTAVEGYKIKKTSNCAFRVKTGCISAPSGYPLKLTFWRFVYLILAKKGLFGPFLTDTEHLSTKFIFRR